MSQITAIYAISSDNVFGINNRLPWNIKEDIQFFKKITCESILIMGKNTYLSVPKMPLPNRISLVIMSDNNSNQNLKDKIGSEFVFKDINSAVSWSKNTYPGTQIFIIGGQKILTEAMSQGLCDNLIITKINQKYDIKNDNDDIKERIIVYGPEISFDYYEFISKKEYENEGLIREYYTKKKNINSDNVYLELVSQVLHNGIKRQDRTGTGTLSVFGTMSRYNISQGRIPLLNSKHVSFTGIADELLWFLSGSTDSNKLKTKIWSGNTSREFLDTRGLFGYTPGLIGPAYGFQWRYFGADYDKETGKPIFYNDNNNDTCCKKSKIIVDQLARVIDLLRNDPYSRRIIMTTWNPSDLDAMALEPCHILTQMCIIDPDPYDFDQRKWLSCILTQRSGDIGLGVPYNIVSYALLCHMIGHVLDLRPLELIHNIGDAHIYNNHIYQLKNQMIDYNKVNKEIIKEPTISINFEKSDTSSDLENLLNMKLEHFKVSYTPGPKISMKMAI